ncbi:hypothetical protein GCM10027569_29670 [Flindersiella endophytica]
MADKVREIDNVRARVVLALEDYIALSDRMRRLEAAFSVQVLHTAARLHETIARRRTLEAEYERIRGKLERGGYASAEALYEEVCEALVTVETEHPDGDEAGAEPQSGAEGDAAAPDTSGAFDRSALAEDEKELDAAVKARIVRDFKRIVLPNVHADTSDTPYAVFDVAHSAYKARDYTLMEAFVIRFRILPDQEVCSHLAQYLAAERRLDRRLRTLRQAATFDELNDTEEAANQRMRQQSEEFRRAIDEECERLAEVRGALRALLHGQDGARR